MKDATDYCMLMDYSELDSTQPSQLKTESTHNQLNSTQLHPTEFNTTQASQGNFEVKHTQLQHKQGRGKGRLTIHTMRTRCGTDLLLVAVYAFGCAQGVHAWDGESRGRR